MALQLYSYKLTHTHWISLPFSPLVALVLINAYFTFDSKIVVVLKFLLPYIKYKEVIIFIEF